METFFLGTLGLLVVAIQGPQATVAGVVRDEVTGAPLAHAVVTLSDLNRSTTTGVEGRYLLKEVPPGPLHLTVRFLGYSPRTLHALVPAAGVLEINVSLRPDPLRLQAIEVVSPVPVRGLEADQGTAHPDRGMSATAIRAHPLLAEPDALLALAGGEVMIAPESPNGVHVRGGASDQTGYVLDGVPVLSPYHAAGLFSAWNPDALEGVELLAAAPPPALPDALSGTIAGFTRSPGTGLQAQGSVSTTQARLTMDGPLGVGSAGFLLSLRSGFPAMVTPGGDASYLRGETGDWLAKVEAPVLGGRARLLGYGSVNELGAAADLVDGSPAGGRRNTFEWGSRSLGGEWQRGISKVTLRILGWTAAADAEAIWHDSAGPVPLTAVRRDAGVLADLERVVGRSATTVGFRIQQSRMDYLVGQGASAGSEWALRTRTPVWAGFANHTGALGRRAGFTLGASVSGAAGGLHFGPRAQVKFSATDRLILSGSYARLHQFAQSLRNPESVAGNVFPADLYVGAGESGVPVARSDQGILAAEYRPTAGIRLGAQAYLRALDGLALVAPRHGEPFSTGEYAVGSGSVRGVSLEAAASGARFGAVASYGLQEVHMDYGAGTYVPGYGTAHRLDGGVTVFPSPTVSVRLGASGAWGRRTTGVSGGLEWEACNLLDRGCEFGGSPVSDRSGLGATSLPSYLRVDLGARKHWHLRLGQRDLSVAIFGTVTNLFGRTNVLNYTANSGLGEPVAVQMLPFAPLVVGLDWRF
jgi:hypothetical protein